MCKLQIFLLRHAVLTYLLFLCVGQLKEFQQKSSPASMAAERGSSTGGAGAKKKRKVKGLSQPDAPSTDRNSPDNVSPSLFFLLGGGLSSINCPSAGFLYLHFSL